jgi:hypothetical protein
MLREGSWAGNGISELVCYRPSVRVKFKCSATGLATFPAKTAQSFRDLAPPRGGRVSQLSNPIGIDRGQYRRSTRLPAPRAL